MPDIRILHVDDEPDVRLLVEASLGLDPGLVTQSCASGAEAIAIAAQWRPDLILLDATMPDMDGPATLAQLKHDPQTAGIPVIFLTASYQDSDVDRFKAIGSAGVIGKPFDPRALAASVRSHAQPEAAEATAVIHPALSSPAGATADAVPPGHAIGDAGSMASGLTGVSAMPDDAAAIVLFDADGHPVALHPGNGWDASGLGPEAVFSHDLDLASTWSAGAMPQADGLKLLDVDAGHAGSIGASLMAAFGTTAGAIGSGAGNIGDRASGYHAASDLIHTASLHWQGSGETFAMGLAGSEIWGASSSATMLHEPKLLG